MNRSELKSYVFKVLLESLDLPCETQGKLIKKSMGFSGIIKEVVCEGSVHDANKFAKDNSLQFLRTNECHFGGHYEAEHNVIYEFIPNDEFYGNIIESEMSVSDALSRLNGENDKILEEVDSDQVTHFISLLFEDQNFYNKCILPLFVNINNRITEGLSDPVQIRQLLEIIVKQGCKEIFSEDVTLSDKQVNFALCELNCELKKYTSQISEENKKYTGNDKLREVLLKNYSRVSGNLKNIFTN